MTVFTCPRRVEDGMHKDDSPFILSGSNKDSWDKDNTCSYCGSLNQDEFMQRLEVGNIALTPTDKSYKVYVEGENLKASYPKLYFQHLTEVQRDRFIELFNNKKISLKYPGYFYVLPFFCTREWKVQPQ